MSVEIRITTPTGDVTSLTSKVNFDLETSASYLENGDVDTVETFVELNGVVVVGTPSSVWEDIRELRANVLALGPKRVQIFLDATEQYDFDPSDCIKSPVVVRFRTRQDEGAGVGHWRWEMSIYIKQVGGQVEEGADQPPGLFEYDTSVSVTQVDDIITRKEWRATAKAADVGAAYLQVADFGPTPKKGSGISRTLSRSFQQSRASGVWVWDRSRLFDIDEEVTLIGNGNGYVEDKRVGDVEPNVHLARRGIVRVLVSGTVYGAEPNLSPPEPHYQESAYLFRNGAEEQRFFPKVYDAEKGIYSLRFEERYISVGGHPGAPNHAGHDVIKQGTRPPEDGAL